MSPEDIPLTRRDFERALSQLQQDPAMQENPKSYKSDDCVRCYSCMFTTASQDCFHCTYCIECDSCSDCTHCVRTSHSSASSYCVESSNCHKCSYVILSKNCYECIFCFGCFGLVGKEFHILNQPFPKKTYFKLVAELKASFGFD